MGFEYDHFKIHPKYRTHKFFGGNHDDYSKIKDCPNNLGDFGLGYQDGKQFFFIRGADSIDKAYRIEGVSWWRNEELNYREAEECLDLYEELAKPVFHNYSAPNPETDIILSHDCPHFLANGLWGYSASFTRKLLDGIWEIRKPKLWVFGHHHKSIDMVVDGCRFVCLNELETFII